MVYNMKLKTPEHGNPQDWLYNRFGTYAYTIRVPKHNTPLLMYRKKYISEYRGMTDIFLDSLHTAPSFQGRVVDANQNPIEAQIRIRSRLPNKEKYLYYEKEIWKSRAEDGFFFQLVHEEGLYEIEITAEGYKKTIKRIQVDGPRVQSNIIMRRR